MNIYLLFFYKAEAAAPLIADTALMFQIVLDEVGRGNADALAHVLPVGGTDGHRIAVRHYTISLLQVQFLAILVIDDEFLDRPVGRTDSDLARHATHIGEALLVVVVSECGRRTYRDP